MGVMLADAAFGGRRITSQRRLIAETVTAMESAFTIEELVDAVLERESACGSPATVYRAMQAMEETGFVERVGVRDGATLYVQCSAESHHHHIVCDRCGRIETAECPFDSRLPDMTPSGFVVTRHEIVLYGLCPSCAGKQVA